MRYILFFLVYVPMLLKAQGFSKRFALGAPATLGFAITQKEGKYYTNSFAGDSMASNFGKSIPIFSCFDSAGNLLYSKMFREAGSDLEIGKNLIQTSDGGFANCGFFYKPGNQAKTALIIKYDSLGEVEWYKNPVSGNLSDRYFKLEELLQTHDKGFIVLGATQRNNYNCDNVLIRIDSLGSELWRKYYTPKYWSLNAANIYENETGYILTGTDDNFSNGTLETKSRPYMIQLDSAGNVLWDWWYTDDTKTGASFSGIRTDDGGYILSGYKIIGQQPQGGDVLTLPHLVKLDSSRNVLWKTTIGKFSEWEGPYQTVNRVIKSKEGYILSGASAYQFNSGGRENIYGLLAEVSDVGDSLWAKAYSLTKDTSIDFPNMNTFNGIVANDNGGFTVVGESNELFNSGTGQQLWLMRTDSNGCITPTDCGVTKGVTGIDEVRVGVEFLLYPNPAIDEVHIQLSEAKANGYSISDLSGRLVMQDKMEGGDAVVQTGNLHAGVYVVSVQAEGRIIGIKRLVVQ